jgi:hypothetical protein
VIEWLQLLTTEVAPPELAPVPAPWVIVKEVAPTVTVPLRLALVVLACTEYVNDPARLPLAPAAIEIQSALLVAVQEHPTAAVTVTWPEPPVDVALSDAVFSE